MRAMIIKPDLLHTAYQVRRLCQGQILAEHILLVGTIYLPLVNMIGWETAGKITKYHLGHGYQLNGTPSICVVCITHEPRDFLLIHRWMYYD